MSHKYVPIDMKIFRWSEGFIDVISYSSKTGFSRLFPQMCYLAKDTYGNIISIQLTSLISLAKVLLAMSLSQERHQET